MTQYGKFLPIQCCAIRATRCAADGTTPAGASGFVNTQLIGKLTLKPVYEAGNEFYPKTACGSLAITVKDRDILKRWDFDLDLMTNDPELSEILTGGAVIVDGTGKNIGRQSVPTGTAAPGNGAVVEAWAKNIPAFTGAQDAAFPWVRFVIARGFWQDADKNLDGNPFTDSYTGFGVENASVGNGPANDFPASISPLLRSVAWFLDTGIAATSTVGYQATPTQV